MRDFALLYTHQKSLSFWSDPQKLDRLNTIQLLKEFGIVPDSFLLTGI